MTPLKRLTGWIHPQPLMAAVLWGGIYPGAKLGLQEIGVPSFTALRIVLAPLLFFAFSGRGRQLGLPRNLWHPMAAAGMSQAVLQVLFITGLDRTTAGNSAILLSTPPLMMAGWLALTGRERLTARQGGSLLLGLVGVGLVVQSGGLVLALSHLAGDLLSLGAAAAWVAYNLGIGPLVGSLGTLRATGWTMLVAAVLTTPLAAAEASRHPWSAVSWTAWAGLVYCATFGMVVAMGLWNRSVHRLGPRQTMIYAYLEPVSALVFAAILLGESPTTMQVLGALLTFAGVWLSS